ncbi:MAG TPA: hypothetical protein VE173_04865 [Longimicrobiales bacterium]|jgi:hypothetical protein|nr:hypothetical protein [Longimicrobiales bacterium]
MPDASLYAAVAYLLTALVLAGYAGRLILRGRWVERRLREMGHASQDGRGGIDPVAAGDRKAAGPGTSGVPSTTPDARRSGTPGRSDAREPGHDVPEVSRV